MRLLSKTSVCVALAAAVASVGLTAPAYAASATATGNSFTYTGSWGVDAPSTEHFSNMTGNTAKINFTTTAATSSIGFKFDGYNSNGIAGVTVDGGAEQKIDEYRASDTPTTVTVASVTPGNHTLAVRVTGTKNASSGNTYTSVLGASLSDGTFGGSGYVAGSGGGTGGGTSATATPASSNADAYTYVGAWGRDSTGSTEHYSNVTGNTATINFTTGATGSTSVGFKFDGFNSNGIVGVKIDSGAETLVDEYRASDTPTTVTVASAVGAGAHTMTVRVTGTKNASSSNTYGSVLGATLSDGTFGGSGTGGSTGGGSTGGGTTPPPSTTAPVGPSGTYSMVFDDEFNGTSLDTSKWMPNWYGEGGVQNDAATYKSNVSESGGNLVLTLAGSNSGASVNSSPSYLLPANGSCTEARVSFPGNGTDVYNWPAWWTAGADWPAGGEHDIAEGLGPLTANYHYGQSGTNGSQLGPWNFGGTWTNAFHTYTLCRNAGTSSVYWDGALKKTYNTSDSGVGHQLILNVGAGNTAVYGAASQVKVDYVRAWAPA